MDYLFGKITTCLDHHNEIRDKRLLYKIFIMSKQLKWNGYLNSIQNKFWMKYQPKGNEFLSLVIKMSS